MKIIIAVMLLLFLTGCENLGDFDGWGHGEGNGWGHGDD